MLSCSIWFSAPSFWMGGGLESRCVGRAYGADSAVAWHHPYRTIAPDLGRILRSLMCQYICHSYVLLSAIQLKFSCTTVKYNTEPIF